MRPLPRPFTIADTMILVVVAALMAVSGRDLVPGFEADFHEMGRFGLVGEIQQWLVRPGLCVVVPLMLGTLAWRLRQPRQRLRRIARQPGYVACAAAAVSLIPGMVSYAGIYYRPSYFQEPWFWLTHWTESTVVGAWLALAVSGRWRAEASWVDRLGRLLGAYWLLRILLLVAKMVLSVQIILRLRALGSGG